MASPSATSTSSGIEAIFYDLDGTLADSCEGIEWAARGALEAVFPGRAFGPLRHLIGPPIRHILEAALLEGGHAPAVEAELESLEQSYRALYDGQGCARSRAFAGVCEGLRRRWVLGARQFVVTNKPTKPTQQMLRALKLDAFIEQALSPDSREPRFASKSEAARWLVEHCGFDASRVLFVGDARDDALAAQAIGARFVAVSWGYGAAHQVSDVPVWKVIHDFSELNDL